MNKRHFIKSALLGVGTLPLVSFLPKVEDPKKETFPTTLSKGRYGWFDQSLSGDFRAHPIRFCQRVSRGIGPSGQTWVEISKTEGATLQVQTKSAQMI
jgi:hypothetical protein